MVKPIDPVAAEMRLAQLLGEDGLLAQAPMTPAAPSPNAPAPATGPGATFTGNPFEDILSKAIEALEGVSKSEVHANQLVDKYVKGEIDIQDVMIAQAKMNLVVTMAVTTVNAAVNTFKEITQMQV